MSFSFCLNKNEMLTLCGLSLLYQGLDLKQEGKLMKDGQRLVLSVLKYLEKANAPGAPDFRKLTKSMIPSEAPQKVEVRRASDTNMAAPTSVKSITAPSGLRNQLIQPASRYTTTEPDFSHRHENLRRATIPSIAVHGTGKHPNHSQSPLDSIGSEWRMSSGEYRTSATHLPTSTSISKAGVGTAYKLGPNLDYLSLSNSPSTPRPQSPIVARTSQNRTHPPNFLATTTAPQQKASSVSPAEWESLLSSLDGGVTNIYDAVYGGPPLSLTDAPPTTSTTAQPGSLGSSSVYGEAYADWNLSPESWDMTALSMTDLEPKVAQSVLSFSEESLSSGDDIGSSDFGTGSGNLGMGDYNLVAGDGYLLDGLDGHFGL